MTAKELAILPHYYVMPLELGMRDTVAQGMTGEETEQMREKSPRWFPEPELDIYRDIDIFAGKKVEVPLFYVTGTKGWLIYQHPGSIDKMKDACTDFRGMKWVEDAGHWVQRKKPETVVERILEICGQAVRAKRHWINAFESLCNWKQLII
ncbi:MAG: hypothetical protein ALECFALPRED_003842 [Alectoria fallacina]|uniref:Uncharacterized protein n=1 Tax=Alectoria fallacina TaxID=1903189 RepID=A0A8H3ENN7_9LECA|nr:MAG: hypothetical protein ALECFALPRED_003842 [Alectoria fallacina]